MKTTLFKPFEKFRENQLLIFGIVVTIVGSFLAYIFNGRYDGVLDLHFGESFKIYYPFLDNLINIASSFIFLLSAAFIINKKTRAIDILVACIVARTPLYFLTFFNAGNKMSEIGMKMIANMGANPFKDINSSEILIMVFFGFLSILFVIWNIALLYNGFKVASNAKGSVGVLLFIAGIILAEVLSKFLIVYLI